VKVACNPEEPGVNPRTRSGWIIQNLAEKGGESIRAGPRCHAHGATTVFNSGHIRMGLLRYSLALGKAGGISVT